MSANDRALFCLHEDSEPFEACTDNITNPVDRDQVDCTAAYLVSGWSNPQFKTEHSELEISTEKLSSLKAPRSEDEKFYRGPEKVPVNLLVVPDGSIYESSCEPMLLDSLSAEPNTPLSSTEESDAVNLVQTKKADYCSSEETELLQNTEEKKVTPAKKKAAANKIPISK